MKFASFLFILVQYLVNRSSQESKAFFTVLE